MLVTSFKYLIQKSHSTSEVYSPLLINIFSTTKNNGGAMNPWQQRILPI